jgi:hypothetical protein
MKLAALPPVVLVSTLGAIVLIVAWWMAFRPSSFAELNGEPIVCPEGYGPLQQLCWDPVSGDVVNPTRTNGS